jgi:hypothetical protein
MIPKYEILDLATRTSILPHVVEKDYALGWLLAGINQHPALKESWVFKGVHVSRSAILRRIAFQRTSTLRYGIRHTFTRGSCGRPLKR